MLSRYYKNHRLLTLILKASAIFFFLLLSILIVACSGSGTSQLDPGTPVATVTIRLGQDNSSPIPTLSPYYCGGWATNTSPSYNPTSFVSVFGKFTRIVNDNPVGVGDAEATATINWPDGTSDQQTVTTTSDGLAVFQVPMKSSAIDKLVTISIIFSIPGETCKIPSAAFFTVIIVSPTPTHTAVPSPTITPSVTPTGSPLPGGTPTGTPSPNPTKPPK